MNDVPTEAGPLSPDVAALLTELAAALNRRGMYPPGHPALARAARSVAEKARPPLEARGELLLAVARDRILHGGDASDRSHPMLRDLADRLHRRRIGGLRLERGFDEEEASALLDALAREPEPEGAGPGLWKSRACELLPTRYDRLTLAAEPGGGGSLWGDLARSALEGGDGAEASAGELARAINGRRNDDPYDGAVAARLTGLLKRTDAQASPELAPAIAELLRGLDPDRLRRLLQLAGDRSEASAVLRGALKTLPADAVLALLKAARGPEQSVSDSLMRILAKLSAHAPHDALVDDPARSADAALREQVGELVTGWRLDDPNPDEYTQALQALASHRAGRPSVPTGENRPEPERVVRMALELGATGPILSRALEHLCARDPLELVRSLSEAPQVGGPNLALEEGWRVVLSPAALARVLDDAGPGNAAVESLLAKAGAGAVEPLLDRLAGSEERAERRWLLDRLAALGPAVGPRALERLPGAPWYVARNLLYLLRRTGTGGDLAPDSYMSHADARVRVEAVRLFALGPARERAIAHALRDEDSAIVSAGLALAAEECPPAAVPLLARLAADAALPDDVRAQAVRLTAEYPTEGGLEALSRLALKGRTLFLRRPKFADPSPLSLAALAALLRGWPDADSVTEIRSAARSARHGAIRAAARDAE
jgi:hypothetical protein